MNATELTSGLPVRFKVKQDFVIGKFVEHYNDSTAIVEFNGKKYGRVYDKVWPASSNSLTAVNQVVAPPAFHFNVNERFDYIERLVDMVARDHAKSLVVTGSGGLGKSHTIFNRLKHNDLGEGDYLLVKGHMTPKSLYRHLYEAGGEGESKIIVLDDCDSVLQNETSTNLLKSALDSYGSRKIGWFSEMGSKDDLPSSFDFTGKAIFISNWSLSQVPQPILSRALYVDVTMTCQEKIDRIRNIAPALCPNEQNFGDDERDECLNLLDSLKEHILDLNLRTMMKVATIRKAQPQMWRKIATYVVTAK